MCLKKEDNRKGIAPENQNEEIKNQTTSPMPQKNHKNNSWGGADQWKRKNSESK